MLLNLQSIMFLKFQIKATFMSSPKRPRTGYPPLRLVSFTSKEGTCRVGVQCATTSRVVDVCAVNAAIPTDMKTFLECGESTIEAAHKLVVSYTQCSNKTLLLELCV